MILVAGVGNIFLADDAFGSEVARLMRSRCNAADVRIVDYGIRGLDLVYALTEPYDAVIIVDAFRGGGEPGSVYIVEPDLHELDQVPAQIEAHSMDPLRVLAAARAMGADLTNIFLVGCEPETFGPAFLEDAGQMGLSPSVSAALEPAIQAVESLIARIVIEEPII